MRSKDHGTCVRWFCFFAAAVSLTLPFNASAASPAKVKPDIPLGEELYEPTPDAGKKGTQQKPAAEKAPAKNKATDAKEKHDASAAQPHSSESSEAADKGHSADHKSPSDPHAAPPDSHGTTHDAPAATSGQHGEETAPAADGAHSNGEHKPSLLEGKVPPATPAKGSGFIWFGVIFVLLALAIFIFT